MQFDPRLASLRGLAALWVVGYHTNEYMHEIPGLAWVLGIGWLGVPIFFALSARLVMDRLDDNPNLRHYAWRRIRRIWPMYFLMVGLAYVTFAPPPTYLVSHLLFFNDLAWASGAADLVFWSICIEEWAYFSFPLVRKLSRERIVGLSIALIAVTGISLALEGGYSPATDWAGYFYPTTWVGAYGVGLLAHVRILPAWRWAGGPLLILALLPVQYVAQPVVLMLALLPIGLLVTAPPGWLRWWPLVFVGEFSFAIYLLHKYLILTVGPWVALALLLPASLLFEGTFRWKEIQSRLGLALRDTWAAPRATSS